MKEDRSLVRASDIGLWAYCQRAWWLAKVQKVPHRNPAVLEAGVTAHAAHGAQVVRSRRLQQAGLAVIGLAVLLAILFILLWLTS